MDFAVDKVLHQRQDIVLALAQRRQLQRDYRQPVVEVFTKLFGRHQLFKRAVGGCQNPHIDRRTGGAAYRAHFTLL